MKTNDNKIMRRIIEKMSEGYYITLNTLSNKLEDLGFISYDTITHVFHKPYVVFGIDDTYVFISYLPKDIERVAEVKRAYEAFVNYLNTEMEEGEDFTESDAYKELVYLYECLEITVSFMYEQQGD